MCKEIDIDDPTLADAMENIPPDDVLIIQGKGGPMSVMGPPVTKLHDDIMYKASSLRLRDELKNHFTEHLRELVLSRAVTEGKPVIDADDMAACFDEAFRLAKEDLLLN